jgi:hypothetical protein
MRIRTVALLFATLALALTPPAHATRLAGEFMTLGAGARALGMGGAFGAVADDASAVYWNPAGIAGIEKRQALAMHAEQFGDLVNYNFASYVQPTTLIDPARKPAFGFALIHLGAPDIPVTSHLSFVDLNGNGKVDPPAEELLNVDQVYYESDNSFAGLATFALETGAGSVGGTLKLIYQDAIAGESSMGIGIDLGYLKRDFLARNLSLGAKLQDATGTYISWSTGTNEFIVPMFKLGGAYRIDSEGLNGALILAADADVFFDDRTGASQFWSETFSSDLHLGAELRFQEHVMIRGGLDAEHPTAGGGVYFGMFGFDYAYLSHDDFEATHRVSILASF